MIVQKPTARDLAMLGRMRLYSGLAEESLADIAQHAQVRCAERGEILFENGDVADRFYGVISGWVKLFNHKEDGTEAVLGVFTQGETFAEATLFLTGIFPATAEIVAPVRLFEFERDYFTDQFLSNPRMYQGMLASLSMHLHRLTQEIEQLQTQNSEQRLVRFLVSLCSNESGSCRLYLPYEKSLIAGRLGMKPETLSRNFSKLKKWGVKVDRNDVLVSDVARLREYSF